MEVEEDPQENVVPVVMPHAQHDDTILGPWLVILRPA